MKGFQTGLTTPPSLTAASSDAAFFLSECMAGFHHEARYTLSMRACGIIFLLFMALPATGFALGELVVGEETVSYTESLVAEGVRLYFVDGTVVASAHDTDANGVADVWLVYEGDYVRLEGHDTTGDGAADTFLTVDVDGKVVEFSGVAADRYRQKEFGPLSSPSERGNENPERAVRDWVAQKSDSEKETIEGSWWLLGMLGLLVVVGMFVAVTRRR